MNRYVLLTVVLMMIMLHCGVGPTAGGSTDTELGSVTGMVLDEQGKPSAQAMVDLVPQKHNPVTGALLPDNFTDTTDADGRYAFTDVPVGDYVFLASHQPSNRKLLIPDITVDSGVTKVIAADTLRPTGSIVIEFPGLLDTSADYVYLPGTFLHAPVARRVVMSNVPSGCIPSVWYAVTNDTAQNYPVATSVCVVSDDTVYITDYHSWGHGTSLYLNTSASGAPVSGDITDFPVLIRFTADNFTFNEAQAGGEDLRFTKSDGSPLSHEIERWDPVSGLAEVWVNVDTVHGNNSTQSIRMYWGNPDISDGSNSASVFDTAKGFAGVWHLGESSGSAGDATNNRLDGIREGNLTRVTGAIGYGQFFDGAGDYFEMGNVWNPDTCSFTVCAWVKPSVTNSYRAILTKSFGDTASSAYGWLIELGKDGALVDFMATDTGAWGAAHTFVLASDSCIGDTTAWHHVAVVIDRSGNTKCRLYIDGTDVTPARPFGIIDDVGSIVNSAPMRIGADAKGGCTWKGAMDECSLAALARSPDWVKLCYFNQIKDSRLVSFKKQ